MDEPKKRTLHWHQKKFVDAREKFVGLFGGVGNGKTSIACIKIIEHATRIPNNLGLVGRLTYKRLMDSTQEVFFQELKKIYPADAYKYNKSDNTVTFWNNSTILFRHLDDEDALLGPNLGFFYIDQAEEIDEKMFDVLMGRLRRSGVIRHQGFITGNPKGHNWIYYRFGIDKANGSADWKQGDYRMITAPTHANAAGLPEDYIASMQQAYTPEQYNRMVLGSWDAYEGQIFDLKCVQPITTLPRIMMVVTACDPAISKGKDACNTAFCTLGIGIDGHIYDLETVASKWSFLETLEQMKRIRQQHKPEYIGVENTAYQMALIEACRQQFPDFQNRIISLDADRDKWRRAKSITPIIERCLFHTNDEKLKSEMSAFNPDGEGTEKKDRVDAMVHALHLVQMYAPTQYKVEVDPYKGLNHNAAWQLEQQEIMKKNREVAFRKARGTWHGDTDQVQVFNDDGAMEAEGYY